MAAFSHAWRALVRRPTFSLVTILTLAWTAAVAATVFAVVDGVLWKPLPYPQAGWRSGPRDSWGRGWPAARR